jgi:hypothetical protein
MKWVYVICLLLFAVILGLAIHESIHIIQDHGQVSEFCFLGYSHLDSNDTSFWSSAGGWVIGKNRNNFTLKDAWTYFKDKDETFPIIAGTLVTLLFAFGVLYNQFKLNGEEDESSENNIYNILKTETW